MRSFLFLEALRNIVKKRRKPFHGEGLRCGDDMVGASADSGRMGRFPGRFIWMGFKGCKTLPFIEAGQGGYYLNSPVFLRNKYHHRPSASKQHPFLCSRKTLASHDIDRRNLCVFCGSKLCAGEDLLELQSSYTSITKNGNAVDCFINTGFDTFNTLTPPRVWPSKLPMCACP